VQYEKYVSDPGYILKNSNLVVCIENEIYKYEDAIQIILADLIYGSALPTDKLP